MPRLIPHILVTLLSIILLAACGPKDRHGVSTDPNAATGFISENPPAPESATDTRGDGILRDADGRPYGYALLGRRLPAFNGDLIGGGHFDSTQIEKWTVIDVWGIWCGDCMADAPYVHALHTAIQQDPDLDFVSIHIPANANRLSAEEMFGKFGSVEAYFKAKNYSYPTLVDTDTSLRTALEIGWTPSYLLVSPDGIVRGYRTDMSVAGGEPVKDFIRDIARVRGAVRKAALEGITIGPDGVGGINRSTRFTYEAMQNAFPGQRIVAAKDTSKEDVPPVFHIYSPDDDSLPLFTVEPSWDHALVRNVRTQNPKVKGPNGERVGQSQLGELAATLRAYCSLGKDDESEPIITCNNPETAPALFLTYVPVSSETGLEADNHADATLAAMTYLPAMANR